MQTTKKDWNIKITFRFWKQEKVNLVEVVFRLKNSVFQKKKKKEFLKKKISRYASYTSQKCIESFKHLHPQFKWLSYL